ncbi:MAG: hypothetical protein QOI74_3103, partial [Micromonosporaceae bacterium]|nr:hypothetical protein [Micromonosporaceae bacterium]
MRDGKSRPRLLMAGCALALTLPVVLAPATPAAAATTSWTVNGPTATSPVSALVTL